jgi:ABC-type glutathione transport system ATPase component
MIIASHKPKLLQLCNRIIVLEKGRIIADGPTAQVLAQQQPNSLSRQGVDFSPSNANQATDSKHRVRSVTVTRKDTSKTTDDSPKFIDKSGSHE